MITQGHSFGMRDRLGLTRFAIRVGPVEPSPTAF